MTVPLDVEFGHPRRRHILPMLAPIRAAGAHFGTCVDRFRRHPQA